MITMQEYIGFLFKEISNARKMADIESKQIALEYAKDDVLKYLPTPRFKLPEVEINIPLTISGVDYNNVTYRLNLKTDFLITFFKNYYFEIQSITEKKELNNKKILQLIEEDSKNLFEFLNQEELVNEPKMLIEIKLKKLNVYFNKISNYILDFFTTDRDEKINELFYSITKEKREDLNNIVKSNFTVNEATLKNLLVNPETEIVKTQGSDISIFQLKAKFVEDGFFLSSIKDENGNDVKVVNFE
ncbi:MAG: hypothetical protein KA275_01600 [Chitinophagaceae bacterium]|nr:hypothetical protein [Chitinophagaceae bacterium]